MTCVMTVLMFQVVSDVVMTVLMVQVVSDVCHEGVDVSRCQ